MIQKIYNSIESSPTPKETTNRHLQLVKNCTKVKFKYLLNFMQLSRSLPRSHKIATVVNKK